MGYHDLDKLIEDGFNQLKSIPSQSAKDRRHNLHILKQFEARQQKRRKIFNTVRHSISALILIAGIIVFYQHVDITTYLSTQNDSEQVNATHTPDTFDMQQMNFPEVNLSTRIPSHAEIHSYEQHLFVSVTEKSPEAEDVIHFIFTNLNDVPDDGKVQDRHIGDLYQQSDDYSAFIHAYVEGHDDFILNYGTRSRRTDEQIAGYPLLEMWLQEHTYQLDVFHELDGDTVPIRISLRAHGEEYASYEYLEKEGYLDVFEEIVEHTNEM